MRTTALALAATVGALTAPPAAAHAAAAPAEVCTIRDERLDELSGLVAVGDGFVVVNDGSDFADRRRIFFLDARCKVTKTVRYPSRPRDTEDLGRAADGTLWVADIGDNSSSRTTVALWKLSPGAARPVLHRLSYPDGAHDAEAILVPPTGLPIIVTKSGGTAGLYVPTGPLKSSATTALRKAGDVSIPLTSTSNPFSFLGRAVVTGGATSPDGRHVVLRTYADAFEFEVPDGDVIKALTESEPRPIALPDEPQGESVAYSTDGRSLLTVSESTSPVILRYPLPDRPAATTSPPPPPPSSAAPATPAASAEPAPAPFNYIAVVAGVVALIGIVLAVAVTKRRRR
ncbi:hypothetical protein M1L60_01260 [Actinoplanes sp. TRM 88003]|uniref:Esterase-like activity of phytase family protein n=1 Tax=Paractinoplanes aksuensis TaxID=2939490 RepID=A0ABT1DEG8_9ACTN|nr:hypothetical protein [Actinoplanes aksuensis]MCO8269214.1 hypothetical protein [Actinoplanes aksuensis]